MAARAFRSAAAHELVHSAESDEARAHAALPAVASVAASSREHGPGVPDAAFPAAEAQVANSEEVACPDVNCSDAQSAPAGVQFPAARYSDDHSPDERCPDAEVAALAPAAS